MPRQSTALCSMSRKDDVFIVLIGTRRKRGGECGVGAEVGGSKVGTGHRLTTAVALEPQSPVCFPTTNQKFSIPSSLAIPFPILVSKELSPKYSRATIYPYYPVSKCRSYIPSCKLYRTHKGRSEKKCAAALKNRKAAGADQIVN